MSLLQRALGRLSSNGRAPSASPFEEGYAESSSRWQVDTGLLKGALIVGFALFVVGVLAAHVSPADGYEVSIYAVTPLYWACILVAVAASLFVAIYGYRTRLVVPALLLGGLSVASVLALPVVRGYYFHGYHDPLTHLGQTRALWTGFWTFFDPVYPGSYTTSILFGEFAGLPARRAMLYVMVCFGMLYLLFVPLVTRAIVPDRRVLLVGAFSGFLLLPINNVSTYYRFHVFSMATLFTPVVLYVLVQHLVGRFDDTRLPSVLGPAVFVFPLVTVAMLFFHPQATSDLLVVLGAVVLVQLATDAVADDHPLGDYRKVYGQFLFLAILFVVWAATHDSGSGLLERLVTSVDNWLSNEARTAAIAQQRTDSAESIGVSVYELFFKFFSVSAVYVLLAGGLVWSLFTRRLWRDDDTTTADGDIQTVGYLVVGGVLLLPVTALHSVGTVDAYLFRHVGFGMVLVTVLGALSLAYLLDGSGRLLGSATVDRLRPVAGLAATGVLVLSLLTVYASPFLYLPGQHVSEYQMEGYETAFEIQDEQRMVWFGGIRQSSNRYSDAMFAKPGAEWEGLAPDARSSGPVAAGNLTDLRNHYETHREPIVRRDHYFVVSKRDRDTELRAYNGVRYSELQLESVDDQSATSLVYTNGNYRLYYVDTTGDPLTEDAEEAEE